MCALHRCNVSSHCFPISTCYAWAPPHAQTNRTNPPPYLQFLSYTEEQRESIMNALNSDGKRLLAELPEDDPLARRIREELRLANEHYARLLAESMRKKGGCLVCWVVPGYGEVGGGGRV